MTHQAPAFPAAPGADPGRQIASLRELLALVRSVGGEASAAPAAERLLHESAAISAAYAQASPVLQRRFDAAAGEVTAWAAAGVEALLATGGPPPAAAASRLAAHLDEALDDLRALLRLG